MLKASSTSNINFVKQLWFWIYPMFFISHILLLFKGLFPDQIPWSSLASVPCLGFLQKRISIYLFHKLLSRSFRPLSQYKHLKSSMLWSEVKVQVFFSFNFFITTNTNMLVVLLLHVTLKWLFLLSYDITVFTNET